MFCHFTGGLVRPLKLLFGPVGQQCPRHPSLTSFKTALWNVPSGPPVPRSLIFFKGFKTSGFQSCRLALFVQPAQPCCSKNRGSAAPGVSPFITVQALLEHKLGRSGHKKDEKPHRTSYLGKCCVRPHSFQKKKQLCVKIGWFSQFACFLLKRYKHPKVPKYTLILHVPVGQPNGRLEGSRWIFLTYKNMLFSSTVTVRNLGIRSAGFRSCTFHFSKSIKSSCLLVASPRGSSETGIGPQKLRAWTGYFYKSKDDCAG